MGLLDKLWDDTVAGPAPDNGLGKLRKYSTFNFRTDFGKELDGGNSGSYGEDLADAAPKVTRSIMIVRPDNRTRENCGSPPISPAGSTPPASPFSGGREINKFRRKSASDAYEKARVAGPRSLRSPFDM